MTERLHLLQISSEGIDALRNVEAYIARSDIEPELADLVRMRVSQINGCAFCLDMHSHDARKRGETEQRLYLLDAWRETSLYSDRERAALAWAEALTGISETHAPDADYEELREHFSDKEIVDLSIAIGMINLWNRLSIANRTSLPVRKAA